MATSKSNEESDAMRREYEERALDRRDVDGVTQECAVCIRRTPTISFVVKKLMVSIEIN
jgi:hypothetical protein